MIFDAHSHWLPDEIISHAHFFSRAWGDIETQIEVMDSVGIGRAVLTYPTSDAHLKLGGLKEVVRIYNNNVSAIMKRYPGRFVGAAILPVSNSEEMLAEWKRAREKLGFRAISLATSYDGIYLDDERFLPLYQEAQEGNIPIFVHSQIMNPIGYERVQDPLLTPVIEYVFDTTISIGRLLMSGILQEFDRVKFIFAYYGGAVSFLKNRFDTTYQMLRSINFVKDLKADPTEYLKRIYVDTGGDASALNLLSALELFGPGHILWGSEWPAKREPHRSIQAVKDLLISEEEKENILGRNLENMIKGV
jgi:predicted TIM-barrel fold metal-dependent hydrolase